MYSIFREETLTGISIHSPSLHPRMYLIASTHLVVNCLIHVPIDPKAIKKETCAIEHIAPLNSINQNVKKYIRRKFLQSHLPDPHSSPPHPVKNLDQFSNLLAKEQLHLFAYSIGF